MVKIIRTATIPQSLDVLLKGQLKFLNQHFEVVVASGQNPHLQNVKDREGVRTLGVKMERKISPLKDVFSLIKLSYLFWKEKPIIVHSITPKAGLLTMLAGKIAGVPIRMHTFTGLIFPSKTGRLQKLLIIMDKLLCWSATHIYPEGNGVKNDLINFKITNKPLKIIANGNVNGIDLEYYKTQNVSDLQKLALKQELAFHDSDFVFVFVGRLVADKGINELVQSFSTLKNTAAKLLLVGPLEHDLDPLSWETLKEIERNSHIISVGFQQDIRPFLAIANALVFPSYREGFPNVVLQAGAMELPSIVTDINGSNEIIIPGKNGLIIPVKNTTALTSAMEEIWKNRELYKALQAKARVMIANRYEQRVVWDALLQEYTNLIEKNNKA